MLNNHSYTPSGQLVRWFPRLAIALAVIAAATGAWHLAAWLSGSMAHQGLHAVTMKTNTALAMLLTGTGLALLIPRKIFLPFRLFAWLCTGAAMMIGILTLSEYIFGWDLGIDQMLVHEKAGALAVYRPNRMGVPATVSFPVAGTALFLLDRRLRGTFCAQFLGIGVFLIGLMGSIGYLYDVSQFYAVPSKNIALPTAAGLMLIGLGILFSRPAEGIMKLVTADDSGGRIVRRLLPLSVLLPLALGYLRLVGERFGLYGSSTGTGLVILHFVILFSALSYILGQRLSRYQSARDRAVRAMIKSEQLFRGTFENAAVGMAHVGLDGKWLRVNDRLSEITGYSRDELLAGKFQEITLPEDIEPGLRLMEELRTGRIAKCSFEKRYIKKDGEVTWVSLTESLRRVNGEPAHMIAVIEDINERKRMEEALRRSEEHFRYLADAMPQLVWTAAPDGVIDYINHRRIEYSGIVRNGEEKYDWESAIHPDDIGPTVAAYQKAVATGEFYQIEHRVKMKDGSYRWHLTRALPVQDDQLKTVKIFGTSTDIDEIKEVQQTLRRTEYELKTLVENSPDIILRFDRDFRYKFVNSSFEQITGISRERLVGRTNKELGIQDSYLTEWRRTAEKVLKRGRRIDFEFSFPGVFGERYFWGQMIPEFDRAGTIETLMLIARDITQRKKADEHIRYISFHDNVTGLYNRVWFEEEIRRLNAGRSLPISFIVGDVNNLKLVNDVFGHREGDRLLIVIAEILRRSCRETDIVARWGGDEFTMILPETDEETARTICSRIQETAKHRGGTAIPPSIAVGTATKTRADEDVSRVLALAEERMYDDKLAQSGKNREKVIASLLARVREQWPDRDRHLERTRKMAHIFAENMRLGRSEINNLNRFILLHDIGKVTVPDAYINKPGQLTEAEWEIVKRNPEAGFRIAKAFAETAGISDEILSLRERWDGTGYPRGLNGEEIPFLSRMFSIIDSYDTMTHQRPYKQALSREEALHEIGDNAGKQFDPELAAIFIAAVA